MTRQKGFTLTEVIVAIIISLIAIFGIETLIVASFKDWKTGKEIVDLQRDLDVASYKIKGVLDESGFDTILDPGPSSGTRIQAGYKNDWSREFRRSGNSLMYNSTEIISTLESITFKNGSDGHSVRVDLTVVKGARQLDNSFLVYLRNKGGG